MRRIRLFDETLRDGEQQVGIFFSVEQKRDIARRIAACGIGDIDIMEGVTEAEDALIQELCTEGLPLAPACLCSYTAIDHVVALGARRAILFFPVSNMLLSSKNLGQEEAFGRILECARYAHGKGLDIDFAAEDASRADLPFLIRLGKALQPCLRHLVLCDTLGCLQPESAAGMVTNVMKETGCAVGVHFHNDLGLAVENTIQAVLSGASLVSGTLTGIGERAGNANLTSVTLRLAVEHNIHVEGLDLAAFQRLGRDLLMHGSPADPFSEQSLYIETGIHVHALLRDTSTYILYPGKAPVIWFGKYSGSSNFRYLFEKELQRPLDESHYARMRKNIKDRALKECRSFSAREVLALYEKGEI